MENQGPGMAFVLAHGAQVLSDLLTIREKGVVVSLLPPRCKLIKTTVAQVLEAKESGGGRVGWSCLGCGVLGLVGDESVHSHFLRLYCVKSAKVLWEQELYVPFQYNATCNFFHTFPADGYQVGLNFANESEAEEFYLEVKDVQRKQELMTAVVDKTTTDQQHKEIKHLEQHSPADEPSPTDLPTTSSDLDTVMMELLMQARLTKEDLRDKDIAEAVDCIINRFGGLQAVQKELRKIDSVSQASGSTEEFISPDLEPVPSVSSVNTSSAAPETPGGRESPEQGPSPAAPQPVGAGSNGGDANVRHVREQVGPAASAERHDLILNALKDVFKQKQLHKEKTSQDGSHMKLGE